MPGALRIKCTKCGALIPIAEALEEDVLNELENQYKQRLEVDVEKERKKSKELAQQLTEAVRRETSIVEREQALELTVAKKVKAELDTVKGSLVQSLKSEHAFELAERDQQLTSMRKQIEELQSSQHAQQQYGEAAEVVIEHALRAVFPIDRISPVGKGEFGGDILHEVMQNQVSCGRAIWESKRTKNWAEQWLAKVRADQRNANADIAVLVSQALPKSMLDSGDCFSYIDGVWVVRFDAIIPFAAAMRFGLIATASAKHAAKGMESKAEIVYQYIAGPQFKQRMQALVEHISAFKGDHERDKRLTLTAWSKKEKQLDGMLAALSGLYGDLTGMSQAVAEVGDLVTPLLGETA